MDNWQPRHAKGFAMALDSRYIPIDLLEMVFLDKDTGAPMSGGVVTFFQDNQRTLTKDVYQITGISPNYTYISLGATLTLSAIGTFEDSLGNPVIPYYYPYDYQGALELYYVTVTNAGIVPQFTREALPYLSDNFDPSTGLLSYQNAVSNQNFSQILFDNTGGTVTPYSISYAAAVNDTIEIAPNWFLVVSGTGTITLTQISPSGTSNLTTNPATYLNINCSGTLTSVKLNQYLYGSPNLFGGQFVTGGFAASNESGSSVVLTLNYLQSGNLANPVSLLGQILPGNSQLTYYTGSAPIPASVSIDTSPNAYVIFQLSLPTTCNLDITSVQVIPTGITNQEVLAYNEESVDEQINNLFYYYKPWLQFKPIPSLLVGWDFAMNPAQFGEAKTVTTTADYVWDQTIMATSAGTLAITRNGLGGIQQTNTANTVTFMLQYLSGADVKGMIGNPLSINIDAFCTGGLTNVIVQAFMFRGTATSAVPILGNVIGSVSSSGVFTLNGAAITDGWAPITSRNSHSATLPSITVDADINTIPDVQFSGFEITDSTQLGNTDKFAIVITYVTPTVSTTVITQSVSLNQGLIPTRPAPQSRDTVLRECQFYYEKSYDLGTVVGTITNVGAQCAQQQAWLNNPTNTTWANSASAFGFQYVIKRVVPQTTIYSPSNGSGAAVFAGLYYNGSLLGGGTSVSFANWNLFAQGNNYVSYIPANGTAFTTNAAVGLSISAAIFFHFQLDSRLGKI